MIKKGVFDEYSGYYDLLNKNKDYQAECEYVISLLEVESSRSLSILELGCGTGGHAEVFAQMGHTVTGIDLSNSMLQCAKVRFQSLQSAIADRISFLKGDIRDYRDKKKYDVVLSLFHVFSYQVTNDDLRRAVCTAAEHLNEGGMLVFDFWHGPGVLRDFPESRKLEMENDDLSVIRYAEPTMFPTENRVDVEFSIYIENRKTGKHRKVDETHAMRYLFLPEIDLIAQDNFTARRTYAWMTLQEPGFDDWLAVAVLERAK
jgi:SAM-dependent methyltransferase